MEKQPHSFAIIRFSDCDPMGHLNNGRYIDYFINAREDHLLNYYDLNVYEYVQKKGLAWVVGKSEIVYKRPANLMDKVRIESQVLAFGPKFIKVEMRMYNAEKTELKSVMHSYFVPFDMKTQRSMPHPEEIMNLLSQAVLTPEEGGIDQRVKALAEPLMV